MMLNNIVFSVLVFCFCFYDNSLGKKDFSQVMILQLKISKMMIAIWLLIPSTSVYTKLVFFFFKMLYHKASNQISIKFIV